MLSAGTAWARCGTLKGRNLVPVGLGPKTGHLVTDIVCLWLCACFALKATDALISDHPASVWSASLIIAFVVCMGARKVRAISLGIVATMAIVIAKHRNPIE